jgi:hypothetical protein
MKPLDFTPLLAVPEGRNHTALRSYAQDTPFGPEIYLAMPIYTGNEFRGLLVTHFDLRAVLAFSKAPDDMLIVSPDILLWPGRHGSQNPAAAADWNEELRRRYHGTIGSGSETFYWMVRHFANLPMIFAVPVDENYAPPGQETAESPGRSTTQ